MPPARHLGTVLGTSWTAYGTPIFEHFGRSPKTEAVLVNDAKKAEIQAPCGRAEMEGVKVCPSPVTGFACPRAHSACSS